jgi:hypothetical protein
MARQKRASARSVCYPRRWPHVLKWSAGLLGAVGVVVAAAYLAGRPAEGTGALATLAAVGGRPAVALAIACAGLVHLAWCVRHLILHWLAWAPGRIEVTTFTAGTPLTDANVDRLTISFRQRLMNLHLQSPDPVPGAAADGDFLDVLGRNGMDARNPLATLIGLARAAKPTHAYEVRGVLHERTEIPRYGVTVRVLRVPSEGTAPVTTWGETWEIALRKAADAATAMILPQTRLCRAPWAAWRGHVMPPGLLHAYEEGARLEQARRYDEALAAYWRAVELDPLNMALRLCVGQLQERLGLYLDALATYWGMDVTSPPPKPWNRLRGLQGRRERRQALLSARYRRNVLLGGRVLAKQWVTSPEADATRRDAQRRQLRTCLRPLLQSKLEKFESAECVRDALVDAERIDTAHFLRLRLLFGRYALDDCAEMRKQLRFRDRATLTTKTLQLTELSISLRLDWVRHMAPGEKAKWPPKPKSITKRIRRIEGRLTTFRHWHEHYNAACAYALPLHDQSLTGVDKLAARAVERLERATARADSGYIASRRDWVLSEDPDLKGLRGWHKFQEFQLLYLPSDALLTSRPRNVQQLENSRYVRDLVLATAERWWETWRGRSGPRPDTATVREWFDAERLAWDQLHEVALNYRHARTRFELIDGLRAGAARYGFARPAVPFPPYDDEPLPGGAREAACTAEIKRADARLRTLAALIEEVQADLAGWRATLRSLEADGKPVDASVLRRRRVHQAALWQSLGQWFEARDDGACAAGERDLQARAGGPAAVDPARNGHPALAS